jgi:hypothetical protein
MLVGGIDGHGFVEIWVVGKIGKIGGAVGKVGTGLDPFLSLIIFSLKIFLHCFHNLFIFIFVFFCFELDMHFHGFF